VNFNICREKQLIKELNAYKRVAEMSKLSFLRTQGVIKYVAYMHYIIELYIYINYQFLLFIL
jgi:hypothetical protein